MFHVEHWGPCGFEDCEQIEPNGKEHRARELPAGVKSVSSKKGGRQEWTKISESNGRKAREGILSRQEEAVYCEQLTGFHGGVPKR